MRALSSGLTIPWRASEAVRRLKEESAFSFRLCDEMLLRRLVGEALSYEYNDQDERVNKHGVRQKLGTFEAFPTQSLFPRLRDLVLALLQSKFETLSEYPFKTPLFLNSVVLQRYKKGPLGITPHIDGPSRRNLVCVLVLAGEGDFALHDDKDGKNTRTIEAPPGHMIMMRAPGFLGEDFQPVHSITNITEDRYIVGLRERVAPPSSV
ncbi:MAG: hypothetical protein HY455_03475 [Parcubacteria group bacterium]|nr:hypothetical protein [Parcubacteria group bacterium]